MPQLFVAVASLLRAKLTVHGIRASDAAPASGSRGVAFVPTTELLDRAQEIADYRFNDPDLLVSAVTHASLADNRLSSNERLEFLGDAILGMVVCEYLFDRYPDHLEGDMTKIKSVVVSRRTCAKVADELGLCDLLRMGKGMSDASGIPHSVRAGVFESFTAALYLDGGMDVVRDRLLRWLTPHIHRSAKSENKDNYKSFLQQYAQRELDCTPRYEALDEKGPDHSKCFEVAVVLASRRFPSAWAPSKKDAEQRAARKALQELGLIEPDDD